MVGGFCALGRARLARNACCRSGGSLVIAALVVGGATLLVPLAAKRPVPLSARFVLAGLAFLLLTILLGLTLRAGPDGAGHRLRRWRRCSRTAWPTMRWPDSAAGSP